MIKSFALVFKNKNFVIFSLGDLFSGVSMAFFQTAMLYYITMLLNEPESQSFLVMLAAIAVAICLFPLIIKISRKYNKKLPLIIASIVFTVVFGLIYFGDKIAALAPGHELLVGLGIGVIVSFPFAAINILPQSVISDIIQCDCLVSGVKREGIFSAVKTFIEKIASAIAMMGVSSTLAVDAVLRLSKFISEVSEKKIHKGFFHPEVRATFEIHAPYMSFPLNLLFGNLTLFSPLIKKIMLKIPQTKAMLSTSIAFTTVFAGSKDDPQMRAKEAEATMFLRCIREDDLLNGLEKIKEIDKKYGIEIEETERDYCKPSSFESKPYKLLEEVMNENFPDVIVAPFLLTAGTDARRFSDVADCILRFAPIDLDKKQYASIHSANEHIKIKNIGECVCFYKDFIKKFN